MRAGELVLDAGDARMLAERMEKISLTGSAVCGVVTALDVIMKMKGSEFGPELVAARRRLTGDNVVWSLHQAIGSLARDICVESERLETLVHDNLMEGI